MRFFKLEYRQALLLSICLALFSCESNIKKDQLLGQWYNESLTVKIGALDGTVDSLFSVPAGQWEAVLGIKPILTTYTEDGKFNSDYISLEGEVLQSKTGKWELKGDSLFLTEDGQTTAYFFDWREGKAGFIGYLDWDNDGHPDDLYEGIQVKK